MTVPISNITRKATYSTYTNYKSRVNFLSCIFLLTGVKIVVVVFTDGFSSRGIEITRDLTEVLKNRGVEFFSIGASDRVNKDELNELTSLPIETHQLVKSIDIRPFTIGEIKKFAMEICR